MNYLADIPKLQHVRVLLRVDFNVPMKKGRIVDDTKIRAALPTIQDLLKKRARIIIVTHLGRPDGKVIEDLRLKSVARRLASHLGMKVQAISEFEGPVVEKAVAAMKPGYILMLENIRFAQGEKTESTDLAKQLAGLADLFVSDAFADSHRAHASVSGIPKYLPSYAGLSLVEEIQGLDRLLKHAHAPFVAVLGGIKMETKIPVMKRLLPKVDAMLIGGGIVNTYLHALGYGVGGSLVDMGAVHDALKYCSKVKVIAPIDVVVGTKNGRNARVVELQQTPHQICKKNEAIFDIGPQTIDMFTGFISAARTLVWNGAMGMFEQKAYARGTKNIACEIADQSRKLGVYSVIGGGETLEIMAKLKRIGDISFVSTGGGAMLEYLAGNKMPGIAALERNTPT